MTQSHSSAASRRGVLKGGAIGLGSVAGAFALSGASARAAEAGIAPSQASLAPDAALPAIGLGAGAAYFLQIDDITGESTDEEHKGWIELLSYSWGAASASAAPTGAGAAAARSTFSALNFMTPLSAASPSLFLATMDGRHIASAVLEGVRSGETRAVFLRLSMSDVVVTSYQTSASQEVPADSASLTFAQVTYSYWQQKEDGSMGSETKVSWPAG